MNPMIIFLVAVVSSGWILGFLLASEMRGKQQPTPKAMLFSLLAVAMPTFMAFILSTGIGRHALLSQFSLFPRIYLIFVAVAAPFVIALAGHIGGVWAGKGKVQAYTSKKILIQTLPMLPSLNFRPSQH